MTDEMIVQPVENGLASWKREAIKSLTNFRGNPREQFAFRMKCINSVGGGDAKLGEVLLVRHWLIHEVEFVSEETGEVINTYRTVLVAPTGESVAFVSQGVANGIRQIHSEFGLEPLDPPLRCKVEQRTTAKKRRVYVLIVLPDEDVKERKAKA